MDKKVYNKPSLKLEIFTPNEYIASCWYIKEGDCYKYLYINDAKPDNKINQNDTQLVSGHTHLGKVPSGDNAVFKTHGDAPLTPEEITTNGNYYFSNNNYYPEISITSRVNSLYKVTYEGVTHYFKEITYADRKGMS